MAKWMTKVLFDSGQKRQENQKFTSSAKCDIAKANQLINWKHKQACDTNPKLVL